MRRLLVRRSIRQKGMTMVGPSGRQYRHIIYWRSEANDICLRANYMYFQRRGKSDACDGGELFSTTVTPRSLGPWWTNLPQCCFVMEWSTQAAPNCIWRASMQARRLPGMLRGSRQRPRRRTYEPSLLQIRRIDDLFRQCWLCNRGADVYGIGRNNLNVNSTPLAQSLPQPLAQAVSMKVKGGNITSAYLPVKCVDAYYSAKDLYSCEVRPLETNQNSTVADSLGSDRCKHIQTVYVIFLILLNKRWRHSVWKRY